MNEKSTKTLFDHLKNITRIQDQEYFSTLSESDKKTWNNYMISRYLSMNPDWVETVNELQPIIVGAQLDSELAYQIFICVIPKSGVYLQYVKGKNELKYNKDLMNIIMSYFNISKKEAIDYLKILFSNIDGIEEIRKILLMHAFEEKEINKIIKESTK